MITPFGVHTRFAVGSSADRAPWRILLPTDLLDPKWLIATVILASDSNGLARPPICRRARR
jgi:hypothetical protein